MNYLEAAVFLVGYLIVVGGMCWIYVRLETLDSSTDTTTHSAHAGQQTTPDDESSNHHQKEKP